MTDWVLIRTQPDEYDRLTGKRHPFAAWHGKPIPVLKTHAPLSRAWTPIPEPLAWACAERLIAAGGQLGAAERAALGLDRELVA